MVPTLCPFYQRAFHFNEIVEDFIRHEERLIAAKKGIQALVEEAINQVHRVKDEVRDWLAKTQHVLEDVQSLKSEIEDNKGRFTWYPNWIRQYRLSRKVVNKKRVLEKLLATSEVIRVDCLSPLPRLDFSPVNHNLLSTSESFHLALEKVMDALKDDAVSMIAVWGMAGVGKTTLVREVTERAMEINFDRITMTSVSLTPDLEKIQAEVADYLFEMKNGKRILIILDDVWDGLDLKAIGIPHGEDHKGCEILLTTRCEQVCISMRIQKVIRLDILSDDEACVLLKMSAGDDLIRDIAPPFVTDSVLTAIAQECQGLPIAVVEFGKSLRFKHLNLWELVTSQRLRSHRFEDGECFKALEDTYQCLGLSYNHLRKRTTKLCFLLCSFFPKDYAIDVEDLTRYAWGLGLYESIDSINKARCEVRAAIENLISSCLLLHNGERRVKMHNLVRHCALWIASQEKISFMKEWQEFDDLPDRFVGEELEILSLDGNCCRTIPSGRMEGMKSLKVFTLIDGHLSASALESLINLRTLHLVCCQLYDISSLGKLEKLEILSFRGSDISELPDEIGGLNYLRLLDLFDCLKLQKVPLNLMRKLSQLEELYFNCRSFEEWWMEETSIEGSNSRPSELSEVISSCSLAHNLQAYEITIKEDGSFNDHHSPTSRILRVIVSLDTVECLYLNHALEKQPAVGQSAKELRVEDCDKPQVAFHDIEVSYFFIEGNDPTLILSSSTMELIELPQLTCIWDRPSNYASLRNLKFVYIYNCCKLASLFSLSLARMERLEKLEISCCGTLKQITTDTYSTLCWPRLVTLKISNCDLLEDVFGISRASFAPQLRVLDICYCPLLNRVIEVRNEDIEIPQLQRLALKRLESLTTFCSGEFSIGLPSLEVLEVEECPQLPSICDIIRRSEVKDLCLSNMEGQLCEEIIQLQGGFLLSGLEKLMLSGLYKLQVIFKDPSQIITLQNLSHLKVFGCYKLRNIFSVLIARNLPQLSHLEVRECAELEQVVAQDRISSSSMASLKSVCFPNLEEVCIMRCNKLKSLFPVSFSLLPKLKRLHVLDASNLREIFGHDSDANMTKDEKLKEVLLPELKALFLGNLPKLIRFTTVGYYFVFPALISLSVKKCPKLIMRFSTHDDSDGSYVRAEIEKSLLPTECNVENSIGMQIIEPDGNKDIEWPENRNRFNHFHRWEYM